MPVEIPHRKAEAPTHPIPVHPSIAKRNICRCAGGWWPGLPSTHLDTLGSGARTKSVDLLPFSPRRTDAQRPTKPAQRKVSAYLTNLQWDGGVIDMGTQAHAGPGVIAYRGLIGGRQHRAAPCEASAAGADQPLPCMHSWSQGQDR